MTAKFLSFFFSSYSYRKHHRDLLQIQDLQILGRLVKHTLGNIYSSIQAIALGSVKQLAIEKTWRSHISNGHDFHNEIQSLEINIIVMISRGHDVTIVVQGFSPAEGWALHLNDSFHGFMSMFSKSCCIRKRKNITKKLLSTVVCYTCVMNW
ncbi:hypothetical protein KP509_13G074800 [Ceratopteris richardii]|uniref:Uncharacterized protein n=1 Tax=Ceratopteris richardii TaxID=49495 RepID=A0A8T2TK14_CERRI|nr:hypothetical protein KP509_13G074800 [Ceratopteris richardii]